MSIAQGSCPSCGAPLSFGVGSSISQVCKYCKSLVMRTDRDFRDMGKVADLALTPSPIAVDDEGTLDGRHMRVLGRVQLDHGEGPWDEWYIGFQDGTWGWLAYAQGNWYVTVEVAQAPPVPRWDELTVEQDLNLGQAGVFRVAEVKRGRLVSGEGELPMAVAPGQERFYADLSGRNWGFATIDFGDRSAAPQLFVGRQLPEAALQVKAMGERPVTEINTDAITCPNCGGNVPALTPKRAERMACPYCGTVSEIASHRIIEQQSAARSRPDIPLGSRGTLQGQEYVVCGYVERSATIEGEPFAWQEYLLYGPGLGFRWLVKDEGTWVWITPVSIADVDLSGMPSRASLQGRGYRLRNRNPARVDYVLGEFYWKVRVGETVDAMDFISGTDLLSRERMGDEVAWSTGTPVPWATLAQAFSLPLTGGGAQFSGASSSSSSGGGGSDNTTVIIIVVLVVLVILLLIVCGDCGGCGGCHSSGGGFSSGGSTWGGGSRGGK
jgi:uncharacterized membrane protein YgcG